jgi:hypothetical protein
MAMSLYGKNSAAGDTPVLVDAAGELQVDIIAMPAISGSVTVGSARTAAHTAPTVGNSSGSVLAANGSRKAALFVNDSNEDIYITINTAAALHTGILVPANGGGYEMAQEQGTLSQATIYGICASGGKTLLVTEWT